MRFSVITPNYNGRRFLRRCIESVLEQHADVEHIIIDGCSTDGSLDLIREYPHVRWISERDTGMYDAINKGIARAGGEIISYLNSDDRYPRGTLAEVDRLFREHPRGDYAYGACRYIDAREETLFVYTPPPAPPILLKNLVRVPWAQPATFWRREVFEKVGAFDTSLKYSGDYDLIKRTMREGMIGIRSTTCFAEFMQHEAALSSSANGPMWDEYRQRRAQYVRARPGIIDVGFEVYFRLYNLRNYVRKKTLELWTRSPGSA